MGTERTSLRRVVIIKPYRKSGNGAKGGGRKGNSGKRGVIYDLAADGTHIEPALASATGTTMTTLSRILRKTGFIPEYVSINKSGETYF